MTPQAQRAPSFTVLQGDPALGPPVCVTQPSSGHRPCMVGLGLTLMTIRRKPTYTAHCLIIKLCSSLSGVLRVQMLLLCLTYREFTQGAHFKTNFHSNDYRQ